MIERRTKRSADPAEALQFLVEAVADRSGAPALAVVDHAGCVIAGVGMPDDLVGLARTAREVAFGEASPADIDAATGGRDVTARAVCAGGGRFYLAAMSERMTGLGPASRAVARICEGSVTPCPRP